MAQSCGHGTVRQPMALMVQIMAREVIAWMSHGLSDCSTVHWMRILLSFGTWRHGQHPDLMFFSSENDDCSIAQKKHPHVHIYVCILPHRRMHQWNVHVG